jgi:hypothetical protein
MQPIKESYLTEEGASKKPVLIYRSGSLRSTDDSESEGPMEKEQPENR